MKLKIHLHSDVGKSYFGNKDNFLLLNLNNDELVKGNSEDFSASREIDEVSDGVVLAVINGIGGRVGEMASLIAVESIAEKYLETNQAEKDKAHQNLSLKQFLQAAKYADRQIFKKASSDAQFYGTAAGLTGAVIKNSKLHLLHLGENRLYLIRNRKIYQITKDQSFLHFLVEGGHLDEYSATHHHIRMELWYYLGDKEGVYLQGAQTGILNLQQHDILLFSTHGLFEYDYSERTDYALTEAEILQTVLENKDNLPTAAAKLVEKLYLKEDFRDSVVMVLAEVNGHDLPKSIGKKPVIESVSIKSLENV